MVGLLSGFGDKTDFFGETLCHTDRFNPKPIFLVENIPKTSINVKASIPNISILVASNVSWRKRNAICYTIYQKYRFLIPIFLVGIIPKTSTNLKAGIPKISISILYDAFLVGKWAVSLHHIPKISILNPIFLVGDNPKTSIKLKTDMPKTSIFEGRRILEKYSPPRIIVGEIAELTKNSVATSYTKNIGFGLNRYFWMMTKPKISINILSDMPNMSFFDVNGCFMEEVPNARI